MWRCCGAAVALLRSFTALSRLVVQLGAPEAAAREGGHLVPAVLARGRVRVRVRVGVGLGVRD